MDARLESQRKVNFRHNQELYLYVKSRGASVNPKSYWGEEMIRIYGFDAAVNDIAPGEMIRNCEI